MKHIFFFTLLALFLAGPASAQEVVSPEEFVQAARRHDIHALRKMLGRDKSVVDRLDQGGDTALSAALTSRGDAGVPEAKLACVRYLLDQGADPNLRTGDIAPLELAMLVDVQLVEALLKAGADPNSPSTEGITPYDTAQGLEGPTAEQIRQLMEASI